MEADRLQREQDAILRAINAETRESEALRRQHITEADLAAERQQLIEEQQSHHQTRLELRQLQGLYNAMSRELDELRGNFYRSQQEIERDRAQARNVE